MYSKLHLMEVCELQALMSHPGLLDPPLLGKMGTKALSKNLSCFSTVTSPSHCLWLSLSCACGCCLLDVFHSKLSTPQGLSCLLLACPCLQNHCTLTDSECKSRMASITTGFPLTAACLTLAAPTLLLTRNS